MIGAAPAQSQACRGPRTLPAHPGWGAGDGGRRHSRGDPAPPRAAVTLRCWELGDPDPTAPPPHSAGTRPAQPRSAPPPPADPPPPPAPGRPPPPTLRSPRPPSGGAVALGTSDPRPPDFEGLLPAGTGPLGSQRGLRRGDQRRQPLRGPDLWGPERPSKTGTSKPATPPSAAAPDLPEAARGGDPRLLPAPPLRPPPGSCAGPGVPRAAVLAPHPALPGCAAPSRLWPLRALWLLCPLRTLRPPVPDPLSRVPRVGGRGDCPGRRRQAALGRGRSPALVLALFFPRGRPPQLYGRIAGTNPAEV